MNIDIEEHERQFLLRALAVQVLESPGFETASVELANKLDGGFMFHELKTLLHQRYVPVLTGTQFRALMDLIMVSDPWPLEDDEFSQNTLIDLANKEAHARSFDSWIDAYHELPRPGKGK